MIHDEQRLRETLGHPELSWLVDRIENRLERSAVIDGATATLRGPTAEQRAAIDRLLGRRPSSGATLTVRLDRVQETLRAGEICDSLAEAIQVLRGPIVDRITEAQRLAEGWARVEQRVRPMIDERPSLAAWWDRLEADGYLRRASGGDPAEALRLIEQVLTVLARLPARAIPLPELAAGAVGDSHALEAGPLATLCLRAAAAMSALGAQLSTFGSSSEGRREVWARVGVLCDELSAPVLVLNLAATGSSLSSRLLELHRQQGEPARLSVRQQLRHPPDLSPLAGVDVYVCENPAIVAAAAARLGPDCQPLVCTEGHPRTATRLLLDQLAATGARLRVRADFDPDGIIIARHAMDRTGGSPWRMGASDYLSAPGDGPPLSGAVGETPWDPALAETMERRGEAVHEERLVEALLGDLAR